MSTQVVRTILRIVAVLLVFAGVLGVSLTLVGAFGAVVLSSTLRMDVLRGADVSGVTLYGALMWCVPIFWGCALFQLSPGLARFVMSEPAERPEIAPVLRPGTTER